MMNRNRFIPTAVHFILFYQRIHLGLHALVDTAIAYSISIGIMQESRDDVYSHLIARRAVARAALHLGSDAMSAEALDALAAVLQSYLERVGKTVAITVEASGRNSAHCNVLDAVRAVELCTSPAVQRVHRDTKTNMQGEQQDAAVTVTSALEAKEELSWKGLASFCFGPQWHLSSSAVSAMQAAQQQAEQQDDLAPPLEATGAGGKVGPSTIAADGTGDPVMDPVARFAGWVAPYPDELSAFPVSVGRISNPHTLMSAPSLHAPPVASAKTNPGALLTAQELENIPDAFFGWGDSVVGEASSTETVAAGAKRKEVTPDKEAEPPRKKARRGSGVVVDESEADFPSYVPSFYPPFPRSSDSLGRTVLDLNGASATSALSQSTQTASGGPSPRTGGTILAADPSLNVRSALVQLGEHRTGQYWGSGWDAVADTKKTSEFAVPSGRSTEATDGVQRQIVPINRASGHPVSRILEGSMDAATMQ
jgi:histone H3/H4